MKWALVLAAVSIIARAETADTTFAAIVERDWSFRLQESPELATALGDESAAGKLDDVSLAAIQRRLTVWRETRNALDAVDSSSLRHENRINLRILHEQIDDSIADVETGNVYFPFNSDSQFWSGLAAMGNDTVFEHASEIERYLQRLQAVPAQIDQHIGVMQKGLELGYSMPTAVLTGRDATISVYIKSDPTNSEFYRPFVRLPDFITAELQQSYREQAARIIAKEVIPAYQRLLQFFQKTYVPQARHSLAATALPSGQAFYRAVIRQYTTLDKDPESIHALGLAEVARIRAEMQAIQQQTGHKGDLQQFLNWMRKDPQFYAKTPHQLLAEASYFAKKIDGQLPKYFGVLPRQTYGVAPVPEAIAPNYTAGRYAGSSDPHKAGMYWVNTSLLKSRPLWALPSLTLHEAVPGHHLQGSLAAEQGEQPAFRRYSYISAYGEGWALYAEHLGIEMGIYETPYQQFGRLVYEMWRACRLVVDTGIHAKGWTRAQAIAYMRSNTALSEHEIDTEVDRYISWPGQALAYKLGEIKIRELRAHAQAQLGEQFDLRAFHDALLKLGSVPLPVLEEEMNAWVDAQQQKKSESSPQDSDRLIIAL